MPKIKRLTLIEAANAPSVWKPEDGLTQSLIGACTCCPLRGRLTARLWRHPKKDAMTNFGSFVHAAIDAFYSRKDWRGRLRAIYRKILMEGKVDREKAEVDMNLCTAVMNVYESYYRLDRKLKFIAIEKKFEVSVRGFKRRGKIDGGFYYPQQLKSAWLMEHKTKSRFNETTLLQKVSFDFQNLYYAEAFQESEKISIAGILYNVIRKPQLKLRAGETYGSFLDRVQADIHERKEWYFTRWEITFSPEQLNRWKAEVDAKAKWVTEMLTGKVWYRNEHACDQPFECEFLAACSTNSMNGYYQIDELFPELNETETEDD